MKIFKNKSGFTLIEIVIIFAIASIVLTPLTMLMTSALRNTNIIQRNIDADQSTQQTFIVLNEAVRSNGVSNAEVVVNYHGQGEALHIGNRVFFLKDTYYVMQTYDITTQDLDSELVINTYVKQVDLNLTDTFLEVTLQIDKDGDHITDDIFPYKFATRE